MRRGTPRREAGEWKIRGARHGTISTGERESPLPSGVGWKRA
ncbi:MAG: hypothetical protein V1850_00010 [Candidatus Bathyarchaeota archaeon]